MPPHTLSPAPDAMVIRTGRRSLMVGLPCSVLLIAMGAVGVFGAVVIATGNQKGESTVAEFAGLVFMLALGVLGVFLFLSNWANRRSRILVDHTGLWVANGNVRNVIPWQTLAGVGLYWSKLGRSQKLYSLELFPTGPIDRDDPVLWTLVRDEEPLHPGLPRLRYRLPFPTPYRQQVVAAVQQYVPHLWLGESERAAGHIGRPDVKGHRQRTQGRTP
ncbi:hypothetical protein QQY66_37015 [Streptomyces sp. DG2A-72]|uniref:hypothetical protein n=1 Tax=Streptomyces sp. DG2A-72 TaxID=3051386 RepID=UPI00265BD3A6|nr:hypothetical protein [Streptomyces sp. DG2A-72]MDO0937048.1 hypothetical protein [Streptomyces sp. DG2A-72]